MPSRRSSWFAPAVLWAGVCCGQEAPAPVAPAPGAPVTATVTVAEVPEETAPSAEEQAVRKAAAAYAAAFNARDAKALAALWSPEAAYRNRTTGEIADGRAEIASQFAVLFEQDKDSRMAVEIDSVKFVSPNVAVETGIARLTREKEEIEATSYTAVYVRRDGAWLLDRVTDQAVPGPAVRLRDLEWMVGKWVDRSDAVEVETECTWAMNKSYLVRSYKVVAGDDVELSGMQLIGWDPNAKSIRSWTFDSDGAFAEADWKFRGGRWYVRNRGRTGDGATATMTNVIRQVDRDSFTWQTIERTVDGGLLPNADEVLIVRE